MLKFKVDSLEGLDESIAALYTEADEGYTLSVEGLPESVEPAEPIELKNTLKKVRQERKEAEKERKLVQKELEEAKKQLESAVNADEYQKLKKFYDEALEKEQQRQKEEAEARGNWEALEKRLVEKHQSDIQQLKNSHLSELEQRESTIKGMTDSLHQHILKADLAKAAMDVGANLAILEPHLKQHLKVSQNDNGEYVTRVVDPEGNIRENSNLEPMSVAELFGEFKERPEFQGEGIFKQEKVPGGSGSSGNKTGGISGVKNPWAKETLNLTEQVMLMDKDPKLADRLRREAGVE
jgi:hypothetical protein